MNGRLSVTHQDCTESFTAERYVLGELSDVERERFEEHYFECPDCAEAVTSLSQLGDGVRAGLCTKTAPAKADHSARGLLQRFWSWWLRPQAAFAGGFAVLALAIVTGYQMVQLRNQARPQVVESILLRPETRGEVANVRPRTAGPFVLLEADLPAASGDLTYTLRSADGKVALEGTGPAPEPGLSFKLLVPSDQLNTGEHILAVRSEAGREWKFRFRRGAH